jgi:hypothetical protein
MPELTLYPYLYWAMSKLTLPTLTSNSAQNSYIYDFETNSLFLQKRLPNLFKPLT